MSMKGKEHYRSIESYLEERGWTESRQLGGYWKPQTSNQAYSLLGAFHHQLGVDCDTEEGGWKVAGITLERLP